MAESPATQRRNELLDELAEALDEWFEAEESRIQDEVTFVKSVLRGRTGSERLTRSTSESAAFLVFDDLTTFLAGEF